MSSQSGCAWTVRARVRVKFRVRVRVGVRVRVRARIRGMVRVRVRVRVAPAGSFAPCGSTAHTRSRVLPCQATLAVNISCEHYLVPLAVNTGV